jgi:MMPL family
VLAASVLALISALGLTVWIFQDVLGHDSLVHYVPFVVALLVSLGSDYNVFAMARTWEEARRRPLREAVAIAVPRAWRAITTAGLAPAVGFGLLALRSDTPMKTGQHAPPVRCGSAAVSLVINSPGLREQWAGAHYGFRHVRDRGVGQASEGSRRRYFEDQRYAGASS